MENTGYPCPACGTPADLRSGCSGCGQPPYPPAAEVIRLDREIVALGAEAERVRQTYQQLVDRLATTRQRRDRLAAAIRAQFPIPVARPPAVASGPPRPNPAATGQPPAVAGPPVVAGPPAGAGGPVVVGAPEASTRTVQGLLFVLGGLLLGTAAVVFTAVAWAAVGVAGRALILAAVTAVALAGPLLAVRRGLRGTAETFAAVGLLLVVLDGYAAWSVDLFGVAGWPGTRYAALVGGASAAAALGYARLSRLTVPWFAALLAAQPVLPLFAVEARPGPAGWSLVFVGVALLNLAVLMALRGRAAGAALAGRIVAWIAHAAALVAAAGCALVPLALGRAAGTPLLAGLPLLLVAATLLGAAVLTGGAAFRTVAAGLLVPVLAGALLRPVAELRESLLLVAAALVAAGLAAAVRLLPAGTRSGPRVGALLVSGGLLQLTLLMAVVFAGDAIARSLPPWRGAAAGPDFAWGWQLPVAVALTVAAVALLLPAAARPAVAAAGVAAVALALPGVGPTPWPLALAVDLAVGAVLLVVAAARETRSWTVLTRAAAGAVLLGHGLLVGLAAPAGAGAALAVTLVAGVAAAATGRGGSPARRAVGGAALMAALLAVPGGGAVALIGAEAPAWWQARAALGAAALLPVALLAVRRHWSDLSGYASAGLAMAAVLVGLGPLGVPADEPVALYAAVAALLVALGGFRTRPPLPAGETARRVAGAVLLTVAVLAVVPVVLTALVAPYGGPPSPWSGRPGAAPDPAALPAGLALTVLALAAVAAGWPRPAGGVGGGSPVSRGPDGWWPAALTALPFAAAAAPVLLVAAGAPWPVVPAVVLALGVTALLLAALAAPRPLLVPVTAPVGLVLTGSGMLGLLATRAGTLAGLGVLVVTATVVGVAGRRAEVRLAGTLVAVAAATALAVTAPLAGGLPLRAAAFSVLAVAVLTLAVAAALAGRWRPTAATLDAAAQAVALVGLLLTGGSLRHAAAVCVLWGAAVALRLLRRGESVGRRWAFAGIAGGTELLGAWLLLAAGGVAVLEAYTLPAAALALGAGTLALRTRPGLNSWLALGPGLAAGLLPSLVSVLVAPEPQPWRRLLLGAAALAVVLAGASRRWQAPVLLGGGTLTLLALHELGRGWDLLPRWIFLAVGGLALIGLAATYERRRRDLARLRAAVGRMS
ncbi:SCO7613 C-terminal domain-containing membrane protein [Micromonospora echinaurantiaca]|uniref:SCO7613 C-terminal domain-containing membrane protein n=1 Tax=Micromonospora echinaurantiaca TaxID=47857 RepID=UPI003715F4F2